MSKGLLVAIIIGVSLLAGIGAYLAFGRSSSSPAMGLTDSSTQTATTSASQKKSLRDLIGLGTNQQCTFTDTAGNSGTMYIDAGRSRGDFVSTVNDASVTSHMVYNGQSLYIWMDGESQGFKSTLEAVSDAFSTNTQQSMDVNQPVDYQCSALVSTTVSFTPPADVEFVDASSFLAPQTSLAPSGPPAVPGADCSACDQLTGTPRDQCLAALSCN